MNNNILLIALFTLLISFIPGLPYGYFQLLRWVVCISAGLTAYKYRSGNMMLLFSLVAILFNPIAKIHFEKEIWQILDLLTAILFFSQIISERQKKLT